MSRRTPPLLSACPNIESENSLAGTSGDWPVTLLKPAAHVASPFESMPRRAKTMFQPVSSTVNGRGRREYGNVRYCECGRRCGCERPSALPPRRAPRATRRTPHATRHTPLMHGPQPYLPPQPWPSQTVVRGHTHTHPHKPTHTRTHSAHPLPSLPSPRAPSPRGPPTHSVLLPLPLSAPPVHPPSPLARTPVRRTLPGSWISRVDPVAERPPRNGHTGARTRDQHHGAVVFIVRYLTWGARGAGAAVSYISVGWRWRHYVLLGVLKVILRRATRSVF